jgi:hypothetical protein
MDTSVSSIEAGTEEKVTRPIGQDKTKTATWKGKGNENSSSQSGSSFTMGDIISNLKKLCTSFTMTHMWKQYNKLRVTKNADMNFEELANHRKSLRLIKKDLNFVIQNAAEVQNEDDE